MKQLLLVVAACLWFSLSSRAEGKDAMRYLGPGAKSCGAYLKEGSFPRITDLWILGFLSGVNIPYASKGIDLLTDVDAEGIASWIEKYCKDHPLEKIIIATMELARELRDKKELENKSNN